MKKITIQQTRIKSSIIIVMLFFGFLLLKSCSSDPSEELNNNIKNALKEDNTIDEAEWNELINYLNQHKLSLSDLLDENNSVSSEKLNRLVIDVADHRRYKPKSELKILETGLKNKTLKI